MPRASSAPATIRASMPTRAMAPLLMSMASTFLDAITLSTCSKMRSRESPLGGSISTQTVNSFFWSFFQNLLSGSRWSAGAGHKTVSTVCAAGWDFAGRSDFTASAMARICAADAKIINGGKLLKNPQKRLRAERAVRADHLNILVFQLRRGIGGADVAVRRAFFRIGELRVDGQTGERANRIDSEEQFFDIGKRFEDVEVHAALFERERLFVKNILNLFRSRMARLHAKAQRADGAGDQDFAGGGFARFAGDLHAAAIEALDFFGETKRRELEAIRAEGVGFDDLRARFDVSLVDTEYRFRLGGIHLVEAAL